MVILSLPWWLTEQIWTSQRIDSSAFHDHTRQNLRGPMVAGAMSRCGSALGWAAKRIIYHLSWFLSIFYCLHGYLHTHTRLLCARLSLLRPQHHSSWRAYWSLSMRPQPSFQGGLPPFYYTRCRAIVVLYLTPSPSSPYTHAHSFFFSLSLWNPLFSRSWINGSL